MKRLLCSLFLSLTLCGSVSAQWIDAKYVETYTQYIPFAMNIGMEFAGEPVNHGIVDRVIEMGIGMGAQIIIVNGICKTFIKEQRPDGTSMNSFPSGHTATAFLGAELVRQEYGFGWGIPAYIVATSVGVMRAYHDRHWWWDVLAGAGTGVLCANIGVWLREPFKNLFNITTSTKKETDLKLSFMPTADPFTGTIGTSVLMTF